MKTLGLVLAGSLITLTSGCASGLNSLEKRQYMAYEQQGALVEEKNPTTGALLGILPGGGSFYAREPGLGVVNLLLWPLSILWDPMSGYAGSKSINFAATKYVQQGKKDKALERLSNRLATGQIDSKRYLIEKQQAENKYDAN